MWRWVDSRAAMGGSKPKDAEQSLNPVRCSKRSWLVAKVITELSRGFQLPHLRRSNRDLHGGKKFDNIISSSSHPKKKGRRMVLCIEILPTLLYTLTFKQPSNAIFFYWFYMLGSYFCSGFLGFQPPSKPTNLRNRNEVFTMEIRSLYSRDCQFALTGSDAHCAMYI
jgi:hypothetical protein